MSFELDERLSALTDYKYHLSEALRCAQEAGEIDDEETIKDLIRDAEKAISEATEAINREEKELLAAMEREYWRSVI